MRFGVELGLWRLGVKLGLTRRKLCRREQCDKHLPLVSTIHRQDGLPRELRV